MRTLSDCVGWMRVDRASDYAQDPRFEAEADTALNGDDTSHPCTDHNVDESCFGVERCSLQGTIGPPVRLATLALSPVAFVAVTNHYRGSSGFSATEEHFVGCVSASPAAGNYERLFPGTRFPPHALVLSNLCVATDYRKHGAGKMLIEAVLGAGEERSGGRRDGSVYLCIVDDGTNAAVQERLRARGRKLHGTYEKMGFHPVTSHNHLSLLRYGEDK